MIYNLNLKKIHLLLHAPNYYLRQIEYYNINNTDCYMLLLDASKAFDIIEYVRLFKLLREGNMCPIVL